MPEGHTGVTSSNTATASSQVSPVSTDVTAASSTNHFVDIRSAIAREKEIKGWTRAKKLALISKTNPEFKDLAVQHGWMMLHPQQNIADQ
jgi:putative endonuclease